MIVSETCKTYQCHCKHTPRQQPICPGTSGYICVKNVEINEHWSFLKLLLHLCLKEMLIFL